jgi:hypothetical protein
LRLHRELLARVRLREDPDVMRDVMAALLRVLSRGVVRSQSKLRKRVRDELGAVRDGDVDAAVELLGRGVVRGRGSRGATTYTLDARALTFEWRRVLAKLHQQN